MVLNLFPANYVLSWDPGSTSTLPSFLHALFVAFFLITLQSLAFGFALEVLSVEMTRPLDMQVEGPLGLLEALNEEECNHLRLLALARVAKVSRTSGCFRQEIFKLSNPGGHPRNWFRLSEACLKTIDEFCSSLAASSKMKLLSMPKVEQPTEPTLQPVNCNIRPINAKAEVQHQKAKENVSRLKAWLPKPIVTFWSRLKANSYGSFSSTQQELAIRAAFASAQPVIWAVESEFTFTILMHLSLSFSRFESFSVCISL